MGSDDSDELLDEVDDEDRALGRVPRRVLKAGTGNFRVVHVFVFNSRGELLLQQIRRGTSAFGGWWGSSVAGHVRAGESYVDAAQRELEEELGISGTSVTPLGVFPFDEDGRRKFIGAFRVLWDGPLRPDPREVANIRFAPLSALRDLKEVTPTFRYVTRSVGLT